MTGLFYIVCSNYKIFRFILEISSHLVTIPMVERNFRHKVVTVSSLERESRHVDVQMMRKKQSPDGLGGLRAFVRISVYFCV